MAQSKILSVPYFTQPTATSCQSTVLKMFATYLEARVRTPDPKMANLNILDIKKDVNEDPDRPVKDMVNSHENMRWWLEQQFPQFTFVRFSTKLPWEAVDAIVKFINDGFPVLMSVSHRLVEGHIVLVVGYENYRPMASSADFKLIMHDPYGKFDPTLQSDQFGKKRWDVGQCLAGGGEIGPGTGNRVDLETVSRRRAGDKALGTFYLLSAMS